jgi:predicted RNA-binding Zn ribbon-like protein
MALPPWVPGEETKPAPLPLLLVQALVNTREADTGIELFDTPARAESWLTAAGLLEPPEPGRARSGLDHAGLAELCRVREAFRALLVHNGGGPPPGVAELEALRRLARRSPVGPVVGDDGSVELHAVPAQGRDGEELPGIGLGCLLLVVRDAGRDGTWHRLKACANPDCRWAFYDRSHARRGVWCDMAVCGNRIKNRTLRSRRSTGPPGQPPVFVPDSLVPPPN